jgi:hypothetical protein
MNATGGPQAVDVIGVGGAVVGLLDGADAVIFADFMQGVPPETLFQCLASGLLGRHPSTAAGTQRRWAWRFIS